MPLPPQLDQWVQARMADAQVAQSYALGAWQAGSLATPTEQQMAALVHTLILAVAANAAVAMLIPKGRKLVLDTIETVLAIALIIVLLAVVLGLPLGIIYLVLKAAAFLLNLVLGLPMVASLVASARGAIGL